MEAIVAALLGAPEIIVAIIVEIGGFIVHAFTGSAHTVAETAGCLIEAEFQAAGIHVVEQSLDAIGERIDAAQERLDVPLTINALIDGFGSNIGSTIEAQANEIFHVGEESADCTVAQ